MLFLKAITNAKKAVYIQTPYFLPTDSLSKALQTAALAKVDVRVMIPERSDSQILRYASFSYIAEMLKAGVKGLLLPAGTAPRQDHHHRRRAEFGRLDQLRLPQLRA